MMLRLRKSKVNIRPEPTRLNATQKTQVALCYFSNIVVDRRFNVGTGSPCNSQIFGEMKIRELQNREFQGPRYLGPDVC